MKNALVTLTLCLLFCRLDAADIPGSKDTPFVKRFEGSSIVNYKAANYDAHAFSNVDKDNKLVQTPVSVEGKQIRVAYDIPSGQAASLEVYRNYENELKDNGFEIQATLQVTPQDIESMTRQHGLHGLGWGMSQNDYYIYATKSDPSGKIHISIAIVELTQDDVNVFKTGDVAVFVDSIQEKAVTRKMVDGTASDMAKQIASTGSVNLYGIYFDIDKTDIKPDSTPTLDEVAGLLKNDNSLKLEVSGHTDNTGEKGHNQTLSEGRANAVVQVLVTKYGIDASRLQARGYGDTKPIASNDTEEGRTKNRRVELAKM